MEREPSELRLQVNGLALSVFEWAGEGRPIFLAHATGFHARCWDQVVAHLPGRQCFALDMRGHGRSDKPDPPYRWDAFGDDVAAIARDLGLRGAIAAGHSKGGHAITRAAGLKPGIFAGLVLIDPVIMVRQAYSANLAGDTEHFAARRRNEWASWQEMYDRFKDREPFSRWQPAVLRDYCEYGLLPNPAGDGFVLACPPAIEAAVYKGSSGTDIYDTIERLDIPVTILRARERTPEAGMDMSSSPTNPALAGHFPNATDHYLPGHSHFIPMEDPALVARYILELDAALDG